MQLDFSQPGATEVDEDGQARPGALGVGWVNPDTTKTLDKLSIARTDPWGRPLKDKKAPVKD